MLVFGGRTRVRREVVQKRGAEDEFDWTGSCDSPHLFSFIPKLLFTNMLSALEFL